MALLALAAPTVNLTDPQLKNVTTNVPGTTGTAVGVNTGFTVPWVPGLIIQIYTGITGCGNITFLGVGNTPNVVVAPSTSVNLLYGPISSGYANAAGLVQVNVGTGTTVIPTAFLLPAATGTSHSPFAVNPAGTDY
jgi:hypothetical protein